MNPLIFQSSTETLPDYSEPMPDRNSPLELSEVSPISARLNLIIHTVEN